MYGEFQLLDEANEEVFAFKRVLDNHIAYIALNFTAENAELKIAQEDAELLKSASVISNYAGTSPSFIVDGALRLKGYEGQLYIYEIGSKSK